MDISKGERKKQGNQERKSVPNDNSIIEKKKMNRMQRK